MSAADGSRDVPDEPEQREAIIDQLEDSEVLAIAALRSGKRCRISGVSDRFDALVVEELPTEFGGYGDPLAVADLMLTLTDWGCVEVDPADASALAGRLSSAGGLRTRFYGSLYYELRAPVARHAHQAVRLLAPDDLSLLQAAARHLELDEPEQLLLNGIVAGAVVDGQLVARAACLARSRRYADIGVATLEPFRGHGFATAAAAEVAHHLQQSHLVPGWSTGESNLASQRIADKLGFTVVARRTYVIPLREDASDEPANSRS